MRSSALSLLHLLCLPFYSSLKLLSTCKMGCCPLHETIKPSRSLKLAQLNFCYLTIVNYEFLMLSIFLLCHILSHTSQERPEDLNLFMSLSSGKGSFGHAKSIAAWWKCPLMNSRIHLDLNERRKSFALAGFLSG